MTTARGVGLPCNSSNEEVDLYGCFAGGSTETITGQVNVSDIQQVLRQLWRIDLIAGVFPSS